ncbi:MAG: nicotinate (nicotinamide) nucleotide adenylyltransferase [Elusimicrobiota bacterium]
MKPLLRIGLFGGSFDPVHRGHVRMAVLAQKICRLDAVLFIPAQQPPHKHPKQLTAARHRTAMLELAIRRYPRFFIDRYELDRTGTTYSYQTVRHFARLYPEAKLFFIMGSDSFAELHIWKKHDILLAQCTPIVVQRTPEASSEIRRRIALALPIKNELPGPVETYVRKNTLYATHS